MKHNLKDGGYTIDGLMAVFPLELFPNGNPAVVTIDRDWATLATTKEYFASREQNLLAWQTSKPRPKTKQSMKVNLVRCASCAILIALTSCGYTTPNGYTLGTTSYLREANRVQMARLSPLTRPLGAILPQHAQVED